MATAAVAGEIDRGERVILFFFITHFYLLEGRRPTARRIALLTIGLYSYLSAE
jgi:hypothetical protein